MKNSKLFTVEVDEKEIKDIANDLADSLNCNYSKKIMKALGYSNHKTLVNEILTHDQFQSAIKEGIYNLLRDGDLLVEVTEAVNIPFINELYKKADQLEDETREVDQKVAQTAEIATAKKLLKSQGYTVSKI